MSLAFIFATDTKQSKSYHCASLSKPNWPVSEDSRVHLVKLCESAPHQKENQSITDNRQSREYCFNGGNIAPPCNAACSALGIPAPVT